jgi:hypothetical protein
MKRRLGGLCERVANLGLSYLSVDKSSAWAAVTRGPECGKLKNLHCVKTVARKRLVETVIG